MDDVNKTATTSPDSTPAATAPSPEHSQPIEVARKPANKLVMMVSGILLLLVLAAGVYAYSQGLFSSGYTAPTAAPATSTTPTTSQDIQSIDATSTQVDQDLKDLDSSMNDLDNLDLSNDSAPAL